ncbi:hypothetical protein C2845_PM06G35200 [Panicum miliaceum]|uniref:Uncharacterized protein n=1 Tax=Panicum miliaceum TaxID=4540 RepID=A0A3L6R8V7_PANMI|nr:hypothetical protein C2845_PM06G35200 [Panicum miliaceum]
MARGSGRRGGPAPAAQGVPRRAPGVPGPRPEAHRRAARGHGQGRRGAAAAPSAGVGGAAGGRSRLRGAAAAAPLRLAVVLVPAGRGGRRQRRRPHVVTQQAETHASREGKDAANQIKAFSFFLGSILVSLFLKQGRESSIRQQSTAGVTTH